MDHSLLISPSCITHKNEFINGSSSQLYDALKVLYGEDISRPEANKFYLSIDSNRYLHFTHFPFNFPCPLIHLFIFSYSHRSGFITFDEFLHATIQYHWDISLLQHARIPTYVYSILDNMY